MIKINNTIYIICKTIHEENTGKQLYYSYFPLLSFLISVEGDCPGYCSMRFCGGDWPIIIQYCARLENIMFLEYYDNI